MFLQLCMRPDREFQPADATGVLGLCRHLSPCLLLRFLMSVSAHAGMQPSIQAWNALLEVWAAQGNAFETARLYNEIKSQGVKPDMCTFIALFEVRCCHWFRPRAVIHAAILDPQSCCIHVDYICLALSTFHCHWHPCYDLWMKVCSAAGLKSDWPRADHDEVTCAPECLP